MHRRQHAQRQHIIYSLDTLLFQLHSFSFFLYPSLLALIIRLCSQFLCSKPRDMDPARSLLFWYGALVFLNFGPFWTHAVDGAVEGRTILMDFVGQANVPSKTHLLLLDVFILGLQFILVTIAYESSLIPKEPTTTDTETNTDPTAPSPSLPTPLPSPFPATFSIPPTPLPNSHPSSSFSSKPTFPPDPQSPYIIDLRLTHILARLRSPAPAVTDAESEVLPFPNTTSASAWPVPNSIRVLMRARAEVRRRAQLQQQRQMQAQTRVGTGASGGAGQGTQRVPGGMDAELEGD